jgi:rubrerythrin
MEINLRFSKPIKEKRNFINSKRNIMKKSILSLGALILFPAFSLIGGNEKTIADLKEAYKGESTASAKYAAYAIQAKKEKLEQIATMFEATSKSEAIHAGNHKTVLEKLGQKVDAVKPEFTVKSTRENLEDAINGESYEINTMYPGFISASKEDGVNPATKSFTWAMDTEKKHLAIYSKALDSLKNNKVASLANVYWVCPKCGNTFDVAKPEASCTFCGTGQEKFIKFGK